MDRSRCSGAFGSGPSRRRAHDRITFGGVIGFGAAGIFGLGFESGDEFGRLILGETPPGLTLVEAERAPGIFEAGVARGLDQCGQLTELTRGGRRSGWLAEGHGWVPGGRGRSRPATPTTG